MDQLFAFPDDDENWALSLPGGLFSDDPDVYGFDTDRIQIPGNMQPTTGVADMSLHPAPQLTAPQQLGQQGHATQQVDGTHQLNTIQHNYTLQQPSDYRQPDVPHELAVAQQPHDTSVRGVLQCSDSSIQGMTKAQRFIDMVHEKFRQHEDANKQLREEISSVQMEMSKLRERLSKLETMDDRMTLTIPSDTLPGGGNQSFGSLQQTQVLLGRLDDPFMPTDPINSPTAVTIGSQRIEIPPMTTDSKCPKKQVGKVKYPDKGGQTKTKPTENRVSKHKSPDKASVKSKSPPKRLNLGVNAGARHHSGMPTPLTAATTLTPRTSQSTTAFDINSASSGSPARIATTHTRTVGPASSTNKTKTVVNKRSAHDLAKSIPPSHAIIPKVPLTDTEVVVFFYNAVSRPVVSLRLYSRRWGPSSIVDTLNAHREIQPPYLRNTCSVKCTTALKSGRETYGTHWERDNKALFLAANDWDATMMIRHEHLDHIVDYELRLLSTNLKKYPEGSDAGVFTQCVKHCVENDLPYKLSNCEELAQRIFYQGSCNDEASPTFPSQVDDRTPNVKRKRTDYEDNGVPLQEANNNEQDPDIYQTPSRFADPDQLSPIPLPMTSQSSSKRMTTDELIGIDDEIYTPTRVKRTGADDLSKSPLCFI